MPATITDRQALVRVALALAGLGGGVLAVLAWLVAPVAGFGIWPIGATFGLYVVVATIAVARIGAHHPHRRFGAANAVTLVRVIISSLFAGFALQTILSQAAPTPGIGWFFFGAASFAFLLDGIDGPLARREGLASAFGSRFDMETDALLILLLSIFAYCLGKAGLWVLISGLLRYIYVAAGWAWPIFATLLPPSPRRKTIAALQGGALVLLLAPVIVPPVSGLIAFAALALLVYSFGLDVAWTMRAPMSQHAQR